MSERELPPDWTPAPWELEGPPPWDWAGSAVFWTAMLGVVGAVLVLLAHLS